jgi:hypothetical protein
LTEFFGLFNRFLAGGVSSGPGLPPVDRIGKPKAIQPGNREWATAICSVAADGHVVPPFLCVAGRFHLFVWYSGGHILSSWVVKTTQSGWTDHDTGLKWLKHFDKHTRSRQQICSYQLLLSGKYYIAACMQ